MILLKILHIYVINFYSREVVDRSSKTQLQVGEKFNYITWRFNGYHYECQTKIFN